MPTYEPEPIDTSGAELPPELSELVEKLAADAHDVWARKRIGEGWTYGEKKDAGAKTTPWLVSYSELPEQERNTDRIMVEQVLKAVQHLDWKIEPLVERQLPEVDSEGKAALRELGEFLNAECARPERAWTFDFDDRPELDSGRLDPFPDAKSAIEHLDQILRPSFEEADRNAIKTQKRHRWTARLAIWPGALAIVFAILQLAIKSTKMGAHLTEFTVFLEVISVVMALVAVISGVTSRFHRSWLVSRQKAERLRSLKFQMLASGLLWSDRPAWEEKLRSRIEEIGRTTGSKWYEEEKAAQVDIEPTGVPIPPADFGALALLNRSKRLQFQKQYFNAQAGKAHGRSWFHHLGMSYKIFFVSALVVFVHGLLHYSHHIKGLHLPDTTALEIWSIAIAAILPVLGFAFRAWMGAFEAPRSGNLFRAKAHNLSNRIEQYDEALGDTCTIQTLIVRSEEFFLDEHREWCRLQSEAEWLM